MDFTFEYDLPDGLRLLVEVKMTPRIPMRRPDLNGPGEPAEPASIEIGDCHIMVDDKPIVTLDPSDYYVRPYGEDKPITMIKDIESYAWVEADRQGYAG